MRCRRILSRFLLAVLPAAAVASPVPPAGTRDGSPEAPGLSPRVDRHGDPLPPGAVDRLGTVRFRHRAVCALAYAPDGRILASGGEEASIRLWDSATGREVRRLAGHAGTVRSIAFAPDGATLASGGDDRTVRLWDAETGEARAVLRGHEDHLWCVAFAPDGRTLASCGGDGTIRLWDVASRREVRILRGHENWVSSVAFSPDGKTLASGGKDCSVRLWDPMTGRVRHVSREHEAWVACVAFSPDGSVLASGGEDDQVVLIATATGAPLRSLARHDARVNAVVFLPDGRHLVSFGSDDVVCRWDVATGTCLETAAAPCGGGGLALSPDGRWLALEGHRSLSFSFWDVRAWRPAVDMRGHAGLVGALAFGPDRTRLVSAGDDHRCFLWDLEKGLGREVRAPRLVARLAVSRDGTCLALGGQAGVDLCSFPSGAKRAFIRFPNVVSLAFAPGRRLVAASMSGTIVVDEGESSRTRNVEQTGAFHRCLSDDGRYLFLYAGQGDDRVLVLSVDSGRVVSRLPDRSACRMDPGFSRDGRLLAFGGGEAGVTVVESVTGGVVARLPNAGESVRRAAFSTDGRILALQDGHRGVRLFDVESARLLQEVRPAGDGLGDALAFVPGAATIAVATGDTSILLWDAGPAWRALDGGEAPAAPDPDAAWADLSGDDAARAYRAVCALARAGDRAVPLLDGRLRTGPGGGGADARVPQLIRELDHDDIEIRERAERELRASGDVAGPAIRLALEGSRSAEARQRLERILSVVGTEAPVPLAPGDLLARHRAIGALERIGSPAAHAVLERLATESPILRERREAREAVGRMAGGR